MKNNSYTVLGNLVSAEAEPTQRGNISVRKFVIKSIEDYPQLFEFELVNKFTNLIDGVAPGQEVNVSFSVRGRDWQGKIFHNFSAFRVEPLKGTAPAVVPASKSAPQAKAPVKAAPVASPEEEPVF